MLPSKSLTFVAFGINYFMSNILYFFFFRGLIRLHLCFLLGNLMRGEGGFIFGHSVINSVLALILAVISSTLFCSCLGTGSRSPRPLFLQTKRWSEVLAASGWLDYFSSRNTAFKFHANTRPAHGQPWKKSLVR